MKVSIITPSYNQGEYLEETILSVLNQTYKNIEYIVIDGGSGDNSTEIIKKHQDKISYWISEKDNGQADAINKGFVKATGDYLCWVNSDDILYPGFIERRVREFQENAEVDMIYGDVDQGWDLEKKVNRRGVQQTYSEMFTTCHIKIPQMSAVWKKKIYDEIGGLDTKLNVLLDWEYLIRIASRYNIKYIPGQVAFFRQHENSKSVKHDQMWASEIENYYENFFKDKPQSQLKNKTMVNMFLYCADICEDAGDIPGSGQFIKKAYKYNLLQFLPKYTFKKTVKTLVKIKKKLF